MVLKRLSIINNKQKLCVLFKTNQSLSEFFQEYSFIYSFILFFFLCLNKKFEKKIIYKNIQIIFIKIKNQIKNIWIYFFNLNILN